MLVTNSCIWGSPRPVSFKHLCPVCTQRVPGVVPPFHVLEISVKARNCIGHFCNPADWRFQPIRYPHSLVSPPPMSSHHHIPEPYGRCIYTRICSHGRGLLAQDLYYIREWSLFTTGGAFEFWKLPALKTCPLGNHALHFCPPPNLCTAPLSEHTFVCYDMWPFI